MKPVNHIFAALGIFLVVLGAPQARAAGIDLLTAGNYNTFIFGDFRGSSDTQGRLAVGGNANLASGYSVGDRLPTGYQGDSLVVGGNLNYGSGRVYWGNVVVGGQAKVDSSVIHGLAPGSTLKQGVGNLPVDFNKEKKYLTGLSHQLSKLEKTGTVESKWNGMHIAGDGASDLQVFNIDGNDLSNTTWWDALSSIPSDATIIFNISGKEASLSGGQQPLAVLSSRVLFNFFEAETLRISGISVEGSILAPGADIMLAQGVVQGNLIANSMVGSLQQNLNPFQPYPGPIPGATPEPGTLILMGTALAALAVRRWRKNPNA